MTKKKTQVNLTESILEDHVRMAMELMGITVREYFKKFYGKPLDNDADYGQELLQDLIIVNGKDKVVNMVHKILSEQKEAS
jgi:hypothetical protein